MPRVENCRFAKSAMNWPAMRHACHALVRRAALVRLCSIERASWLPRALIVASLWEGSSCLLACSVRTMYVLAAVRLQWTVKPTVIYMLLPFGAFRTCLSSASRSVRARRPIGLFEKAHRPSQTCSHVRETMLVNVGVTFTHILLLDQWKRATGLLNFAQRPA